MDKLGKVTTATDTVLIIGGVIHCLASMEAPEAPIIVLIIASVLSLVAGCTNSTSVRKKVFHWTTMIIKMIVIIYILSAGLPTGCPSCPVDIGAWVTVVISTILLAISTTLSAIRHARSLCTGCAPSISDEEEG